MKPLFQEWAPEKIEVSSPPYVFMTSCYSTTLSVMLKFFADCTSDSVFYNYHVTLCDDNKHSKPISMLMRKGSEFGIS